MPQSGIHSGPPGSDPGRGALATEILKETSPELGIKIAYDFGRKLRIEGAEESTFGRLVCDYIEEPFAGMTLLRYIRAGFKAGFFYQPLPWRRRIDDEESLASLR